MDPLLPTDDLGDGMKINIFPSGVRVTVSQVIVFGDVLLAVLESKSPTREQP